MPPDCHNYSSHNNMNSGVILNLRNQGELEYGRLLIYNNYGANVKVEIYHPDSWLDEYYHPWGNRYWSVSYNMPNGNTLVSSGEYFNVGGDWGIRVTFGNGVKSCIRTIHYYSESTVYNGISYLKVHLKDIYEGSYSWGKNKDIEKLGDNLKSTKLKLE